MSCKLDILFLLPGIGQEDPDSCLFEAKSFRVITMAHTLMCEAEILYYRRRNSATIKDWLSEAPFRKSLNFLLGAGYTMCLIFVQNLLQEDINKKRRPHFLLRLFVLCSFGALRGVRKPGCNSHLFYLKVPDTFSFQSSFLLLFAEYWVQIAEVSLLLSSSRLCDLNILGTNNSKLCSWSVKTCSASIPDCVLCSEGCYHPAPAVSGAHEYYRCYSLWGRSLPFTAIIC